MNYTWMGNGYAWDFFLVGGVAGGGGCSWLLHVTVCVAAAVLGLPRPGSRPPPRPYPTPPHPPQIPLSVSLGSLMLCAAANHLLQRCRPQPAVRGFTAPATHPALYPAHEASGERRRRAAGGRPAPADASRSVPLRSPNRLCILPHLSPSTCLPPPCPSRRCLAAAAHASGHLFLLVCFPPADGSSDAGKELGGEGQFGAKRTSDDELAAAGQAKVVIEEVRRGRRGGRGARMGWRVCAAAAGGQDGAVQAQYRPLALHPRVEAVGRVLASQHSTHMSACGCR